MGIIIEFPADAASRRMGGSMDVAPRQGTGTILILPVVRIERHIDETNGGSGPEEALARVLEAPVLFLGVGLPDDRIHAPNERMVMNQFWKGLLAAGELWREIGGIHGTAD